MNYFMGFVGDKGRVYETFQWTEANGDTPAENAALAGVYAKYKDYVAPKKNHIRATVEFSRRKQDPGEKFDSFVTALRVLVRDCGFEQMEERMVRDAIVLRSHNEDVMERCLDEGDTLTLAKAIGIGQTLEMSRDSLRFIRANEENKKVNALTKYKSRPNKTKTVRYESRYDYKPAKNDSRGDQRQSGSRQTQDLCEKCGYSPDHMRCPARNEKCNHCGYIGHFKSVCRIRQRGIQNQRSNQANAVDSEDDSDECMHLANTVLDQVTDEDAASLWQPFGESNTCMSSFLVLLRFSLQCVICCAMSTCFFLRWEAWHS